MHVFGPRPVRFGELAGRLLKGSTVFDWAAWGVQAMAASLEYPLEELIRDGKVPYAPAGVTSQFSRYPTLGDAVSLDVMPIAVGDHRIELAYAFAIGGTTVGRMEIAHVTIDAAGAPVSLPAEVQSAITQRQGTPSAHPEANAAEGAFEGDGFDTVVTFRTPHSEAVDLGYFAEYPKVARISLEARLEEQGVTFPMTPLLRLRAVDWSFRAPIATGDVVTVTTTPQAITEDGLTVEHTFSAGGRTAISGRSVYAPYDPSGHRATFPTPILDDLRAALA